MAKRHVHSIWSKIEGLSPWYLLAAALIFGSISVYNLRQNNLTMVKLRNQVFATDQKNGDVETALKNLRKFIYSHMNTNLDTGTGIKPPVQLKYRFERLVKAETDRVNAINAKVYKNANATCGKLYPTGFGGIPCVEKYVKGKLATAQPVPEDLYKFDFLSPRWTPDLAGWTLLLSIIFFLLFAVRFGLEIWVRHDLRKQI